jgi:RNA polymerase sigma-70 factor (ECF subfamily)
VIAVRKPVVNEPSDEQLVDQVRQGDPAAFDVLVRRHQRSIFLLAHRYLGHVEDARDLTQRVFVQMYRQLARFRGEASVRTWLYRIASNLALDALRARGREARGRAQLEPPAPPMASPSSEERARLRRAIAELPPRQRLVVELRVFDDLSFREIGDVVGSSEDAAKVNFHHALKALRGMLGDET